MPSINHVTTMHRYNAQPIMIPFLIMLGALAYGCAGSPIDPDRSEHFISAGRAFHGGSFGNMDSAEIAAVIVDEVEKRTSMRYAVMWSVPIARFEGTTIRPRGYYEFSSWNGWELLVHIAELSAAKGEPADRTALPLLCISYVIRKRINGSNGPWSRWAPYTIYSDAFRSTTIFRSPLHLEDAAFHVERVADLMIVQRSRLIDRDQCIAFDSDYLINWDSLFNARPTFAYPICN